MVYNPANVCYFPIGRGCRLVAVPAFKAVWGAIALSPVGSIPTPSAKQMFGQTGVWIDSLRGS